jgi:very-short-patch-repair endonuclease
MLQWHYRSRDERLIAFSNAYIYDKMLTTFPGIGGDRCLSHLEVEWEPGSDTNSPSAEVRRAVDLILEHAATRPDESLGVIAMGIKHANRIDEALRQRLLERPDLGDFFAEDVEEPFFVKNLERVQGDERDAIILTIGYGKNERGQMVYRFGPLLTEGGERRLNVAVTRAKRRLTLVTSFSSGDLDPDHLNSQGMRLLRNYLIYAESGGANLGEQALAIPALNPFEVDVRDTLMREGLRLTPQYGASGYRIDFAVHHPDYPGRFILAIECDGASFHSAETARDRDRLRQEQLERIGWRFHRIWSSEWFHNKKAAVEKVIAAYQAAISDGALTQLRTRDGRRQEILDGASSSIPGAKTDTDEQPRQRVDSAASPARATEHISRRSPRPNVPRGWKIHEYWRHQLVEIVKWIESDDLLRTEDEVIDEAMRELGFRRRGANIVATLRWAVREARGGERAD